MIFYVHNWHLQGNAWRSQLHCLTVFSRGGGPNSTPCSDDTLVRIYTSEKQNPDIVSRTAKKQYENWGEYESSIVILQCLRKTIR